VSGRLPEIKKGRRLIQKINGYKAVWDDALLRDIHFDAGCHAGSGV
jgi:hypothetical protein